MYRIHHGNRENKDDIDESINLDNVHDEIEEISTNFENVNDNEINLDEDDVYNEQILTNFENENDNNNENTKFTLSNNEDSDIESNASSQNERDNSDSSEDENENVFLNENNKEQIVTELIREWALDGGHLSMKKLDKLLGKLVLFFLTCLCYS